MSDTRGLLDRISAFRQRLDATPNLIPDALPVDAAGALPVVSEAEAFRFSLRRIGGTGGPADQPVPQYTDRAQRLLARAKGLLDRQRAFTNDALYAACAARDEADPLVGYHRETVGILDSVVRLAQAFPDSAGAQLKLCDGLSGLLGVVQDRLTVQEKLLVQRHVDEGRVDKLAGFFTALHCNLPVAMETVAGLAEELLDEARRGLPVRFRAAPVGSASSPGGAQAYAVPARFIAAHAINVAQVVARLVPFDYEWAARPLPPVVAALLMDCGMMTVPAAVLSKRTRSRPTTGARSKRTRGSARSCSCGGSRAWPARSPRPSPPTTSGATAPATRPASAPPRSRRWAGSCGSRTRTRR